MLLVMKMRKIFVIVLCLLIMLQGCTSATTNMEETVTEKTPSESPDNGFSPGDSPGNGFNPWGGNGFGQGGSSKEDNGYSESGGSQEPVGEPGDIEEL